MPGLRLVDKLKFTAAFGPAVPTSAAPPYVSMANFEHLTVEIDALNGASGITPVVVALQQAQDVAGTGAKALGFATAWIVADVAAGDAPVQTAVVANTFTLGAVASKTSKYLIEIDEATLDVANGFTAVKVTLANGAAQTVCAGYILSGPRYGGNFASLPTALA